MKTLIGEVSIKVLQEIPLEGIPVESKVVWHALNNHLYMDKAVLEDRMHFLSISGDIVVSAKVFIVFKEGSDI